MCSLRERREKGHEKKVYHFLNHSKPVSSKETEVGKRIIFPVSKLPKQLY